MYVLFVYPSQKSKSTATLFTILVRKLVRIGSHAHFLQRPQHMNVLSRFRILDSELSGLLRYALPLNRSTDLFKD